MGETREVYVEVVYTVGGTYRVAVPRGARTKEEVVEEARREVEAALESLNEENLDLELGLMANEPDTDWEDE